MIFTSGPQWVRGHHSNGLRARRKGPAFDAPLPGVSTLFRSVDTRPVGAGHVALHLGPVTRVVHAGDHQADREYDDGRNPGALRGEYRGRQRNQCSGAGSPNIAECAVAMGPTATRIRDTQTNARAESGFISGHEDMSAPQPERAPRGSTDPLIGFRDATWRRERLPAESISGSPSANERAFDLQARSRYALAAGGAALWVRFDSAGSRSAK
jgi:hypothetical protein